MSLWRKLGVERVVLARELGLAEIGKIAGATDMPLEVFVHGALCVAYSGQCLTSESLGGRSANRGQCAQACRLPYQLLVDGVMKEMGEKAYLLSPSDLAAHDLIGELTRLGVVSFKIEGRLKSAHYVAATTQTYRGAIDAAIAGKGFEISERQSHDLEQTFSRGFTQGFLSGGESSGVGGGGFFEGSGDVGGGVSVVAKHGRSIMIRAETRRHEGTKDHEEVLLLKAGDGVLFQEGKGEKEALGGRVYGVRASGRDWELSFADEIDMDGVSVGAVVWKTDDPAVKKRLEQSYARDVTVRRFAVDFVVRGRVGERLVVIGKVGGKSASAAWEERVLEKANKFAARLWGEHGSSWGGWGETPFELGEVVVEGDGEAMVPKSVLNELRRRVVEELMEQRSGGHVIENAGALEMLRGEIELGNSSAHGMPALHVLVRNLEQLGAVLGMEMRLKPTTIYADFEDVRRYPEGIRLCREAGVKVALATLRVVKPGEEGFLKQVSDCEPDALLVRCLGAIHYYHEKAPHLPLIGDYALNVANELTANLFAGTGGAGLVRIVPSYDLNWVQLAAMLRRFDTSKFETVLHQHMPMFHMEHCVFAHTLSNGKDFRDCGRPCEKHRVDLTDRVGEAHPLIPDVGCRNTLFNAKAQTAAEYLPELLKLGIRHFRVELLRENGAEAVGLLEKYTRLLLGEERPLETVRSLRVLNQLGVTRGTLAHE